MKRWICLLLAALLLTTATACSSAQEPDSSAAEETRPTAAPLLDVDLENLLTTEQISDAIGESVGAPQMYEDNTWAHYTGTDSATTVDISLDETTRSVFDARAALYPNKTQAPLLGDISWWNAETSELLTYGGGHTISVRVVFAQDTSDEDMLLMATRHLTALILEKLAA